MTTEPQGGEEANPAGRRASGAEEGVWLRVAQLELPLDHAEEALRAAAARRLGLPPGRIRRLEVFRRAVDARRGKPVRWSYTVDVETAGEPALERGVRAGTISQTTLRPDERYRFLERRRFRLPEKRPLVVGTGPAGLFAGLLLARLGFRPVLLERGKPAGDRARDVTRFWRTGEGFDPDSNVQFGEGGAGTFSDGKLYTQIKDREHRCRWILEQLAAHGAPAEILVESRPHIGTDRLIKVLRGLRETIGELGGEFRFGARVDDLLVDGGRVRGVRLAGGEEIEADDVLLAVGHSARDVFELLERRGIALEGKPFSVGVRIEHPQESIDLAQYGRQAGNRALGAAAYKFVHHTARGRGVYSFCMCPGGLVVGAASEPGRLVTNGMSTFARDKANANAGFMVEVRPEDFRGGGPLAGVAFQRELEEAAFRAGGGGYRAPAQLLGDFLAGKPSRGAGGVEPSFRPGVEWTDLRAVLPAVVVESLREAAPRIERVLPGFLRGDAVLTAVESRSSSPLRVTRDEALQCPGARGLYPAGEGAGYAGGIISAAADGMRVAEALAEAYAAG